MEKEREREEALGKLKGVLVPGDVVYTVLRKISRTGMQWVLQVVKFACIARCASCGVTLREPPTACPACEAGLGQRRYQAEHTLLAYQVSRALDYRYDREVEGLIIPVSGQDLGLVVVRELAGALYGAGWVCLGRDCPSGVHQSEDPKAPRGAGVIHMDDGALRHLWL